MKKWLIWCLTVLAMVCLIPGIVLNVKAADSIYTYCFVCTQQRNSEILEYIKFDSTKHRIHIKCSVCGRENSIIYGNLSDHTGGTETPTCTTGKTCEKCGAEYGILGHKWKTPANASLGNGTHRIICVRCGLNGTASCTGGTATCTTKAVCEACGGKYGKRNLNNHALVHYDAQAPTCTEMGWDAFDTCPRCYYTTFRAIPALKHDLEHHEAKAPTCTEKGWDAYDTCSRSGCDYTTYVELPAQHDLVHHEAKSPTCKEIGWDAYETCSRCDHTTYAELPALNHDYQAVTVEPACETDGYTIFTCSRCKDSYTADPTDKLGHQFGAWSPNGTGAQSASCLRQGCAHTGSTDCRKFTFRTAEGETLTFCPVCGQAENAAQLEMIDAATAWAASGSLSAEDVTARTNGEYLSVAFETAGSLTQPTGLVRLALPAGLLEGKKLVRIAPDGTQAEMPFETERGTIILTLDFANSELPVMLFRLVPQTAAL